MTGLVLFCSAIEDTGSPPARRLNIQGTSLEEKMKYLSDPMVLNLWVKTPCVCVLGGVLNDYFMGVA